MKRQQIWDWAIEAYDPPGILTAFKLRRAVKHLKKFNVAPNLPPDVWKALSKSIGDMKQASGALSSEWRGGNWSE